MSKSREEVVAKLLGDLDVRGIDSGTEAVLFMEEWCKEKNIYPCPSIVGAYEWFTNWTDKGEKICFLATEENPFGDLDKKEEIIESTCLTEEYRSFYWGLAAKTDWFCCESERSVSFHNETANKGFVLYVDSKF